MWEPEQAEILHMLREGRSVLDDSLGGLKESQADRTPPSGGWSVLGCVEHLAITEQFLLSRLREGSLSDRSHENREIEAVIRARAMDRTRRIECPPEALPAGRFGSVDEALAAFDLARAQTERFVEEFPHDPRSWLTQHPLTTRPVNGYEMLLMMALHPVRHARQIEETRRNLENGYGET